MKNAKNTFEVGKTYWTRSVCDSECIVTITVAKRTAKFLTTTEGERQDYDGDNSVFDHIFVDQRNGYSGDDAYGHVYYPVDGKYLKVAFSA